MYGFSSRLSITRFSGIRGPTAMQLRAQVVDLWGRKRPLARQRSQTVLQHTAQ